MKLTNRKVLLALGTVVVTFGSVVQSFQFSTPLTIWKLALLGTRKFPLAKEKDSDDTWDANVDYDKEWPSEISSSVDPTTRWDALPATPVDDGLNPKLGINIGAQLQPMTPQQLQELKAEASELINDAIAAGIDDIDKMRSKMKIEMEKSREARMFASEVNAQEKSRELMTKIDQLTEGFLSATKATRESTKMAAAASKAMEGSGKGLEMGTWGTLGGLTVLADGGIDGGSLLGSVDSAKWASSMSSSPQAATEDTGNEPSENRIIIIADEKQVSAMSQ